MSKRIQSDYKQKQCPIVETVQDDDIFDNDDDQEPIITKQRFKERPSTSHPTEYIRDKEEPGLVIIINQTFANDETRSERKGTENDVSELVTTFGRLGYNIEEKHILNDLKREKILQRLESIAADQNKTKCNCLILVFLTHGNDDNMLETADFPIKVNDLWKIFDECENLKGKPKLYLIQACKGEGTTTVDGVLNENINIVPTSLFNLQTPPDILMVFATREGTVSFRDTLKGSWFIQEFCKNALAYGKIEDVVSIVTRTAKCVANAYYVIEQSVLSKQMPTSISTLTRKFYLTSNKHRQFLLDEMQVKDELIKNLTAILQTTQAKENASKD